MLKLKQVFRARQHSPVDVGVADTTGEVLGCAARGTSIVEGLDVGSRR